MNMYKNKPMAHHETDLLTRFKSAILQETSTKSQPWQNTSIQKHYSYFFFFFYNICARFLQTINVLHIQADMLHRLLVWMAVQIVTWGYKAHWFSCKDNSPIYMSCRSHQLVQLISVVFIGQKNAATKHGDPSSALHKVCCFTSVWSFLGVINK